MNRFIRVCSNWFETIVNNNTFFFDHYKTALIFGASVSAHFLYSNPEG
jgi:hypothetical protein